MKSQELTTKIEEFKGIKKSAYEVLKRIEEARFSKQILIYNMWIEHHKPSEASLNQFALDLLNDKFKVESFTRAARKVVEAHPGLGNPKRHELANQMKTIIRESDLNPDQLEINFGVV